MRNELLDAPASDADDASRAGAEPSVHAPRTSFRPATILFTTTVALNAALLFAVEPLVSRLVLPLLGGTPAVWGTCLVFFQGLLLLGYAYSHLSARRRHTARCSTSRGTTTTCRSCAATRGPTRPAARRRAGWP